MKKKILFVFRHEYEDLWKDGLWAALAQLSHHYEITMCNILHDTFVPYGYSFVLGWGAFGSAVDKCIKDIPVAKGLCIAGTAGETVECTKYDVLFYETEWYRQYLVHPNTVRAFGINTAIYKPKKLRKFWDYITVGAFALWKRQHLLANKKGYKLAVGEIQQGNPQESLKIIARLLAAGIEISDMVTPERLAVIYNMSKNVYIPADIVGGGERAVLEARACNIPVTIEADNPKLQELLDGPVLDHIYYSNQLKKGIESCL